MKELVTAYATLQTLRGAVQRIWQIDRAVGAGADIIITHQHQPFLPVTRLIQMKNGRIISEIVRAPAQNSDGEHLDIEDAVLIQSGR